MSSDYNFGNYTGTSAPNGPTDISTVAKDVAILFLTGVGIVIALIAGVYISAVICEKLCLRLGCCRRFQHLHTNGPRHIEGGEIARDAGLTGMTKQERRAVIDKMLASETYRSHREKTGSSEPQDKKVDENSNHTIESGSTDVSGETESVPAPVCPFESDSYLQCTICIDEYDDDDEVCVGECAHMFHKECLLDWLERKDVCPFCRKNMFTSEQLREAAVDVLGEQRVLDISMGIYSMSRIGIANNINTSRANNVPQTLAMDLELGPVSNTEDNGDAFESDAGEGFGSLGPQAL